MRRLVAPKTAVRLLDARCSPQIGVLQQAGQPGHVHHTDLDLVMLRLAARPPGHKVQITEADFVFAGVRKSDRGVAQDPGIRIDLQPSGLPDTASGQAPRGAGGGVGDAGGRRGLRVVVGPREGPLAAGLLPRLAEHRGEPRLDGRLNPGAEVVGRVALPLVPAVAPGPRALMLHSGRVAELPPRELLVAPGAGVQEAPGEALVEVHSEAVVEAEAEGLALCAVQAKGVGDLCVHSDDKPRTPPGDATCSVGSTGIVIIPHTLGETPIVADSRVGVLKDMQVVPLAVVVPHTGVGVGGGRCRRVWQVAVQGGEVVESLLVNIRGRSSDTLVMLGADSVGNASEHWGRRSATTFQGVVYHHDPVLRGAQSGGGPRRGGNVEIEVESIKRIAGLGDFEGRVGLPGGGGHVEAVESVPASTTDSHELDPVTVGQAVGGTQRHYSAVRSPGDSCDVDGHGIPSCRQDGPRNLNALVCIG
mmetsp:Transcript_8534/g.18703  ORF Transcript_8534/g.18703 Transcript_8534/m.18703 type:complete len:475 (+) Transcript_8534:126-1550(+)